MNHLKMLTMEGRVQTCKPKTTVPKLIDTHVLLFLLLLFTCCFMLGVFFLLWCCLLLFFVFVDDVMGGATHVKDCNDEVITTNALVIKQDKVDSIPCAKLDKCGNHVNCVSASSVKFSEQNTSNLFSADDALEHDWIDVGNRDNG